MDIQDLLQFCNQERLFDIRPDASSHEVAAKLKLHNVGALLVTDVNREMLGVVSERDLTRAFAEEGATLSHRIAEDLMTREIISCSVTDDVVETMTRLNELNIRHIPVLEGGRAVAMLSIRDFEHACKELQEQATTDGLTGLSNRRAFEAKLHSEHQLHRRFKAPLSVAMFDVDHFKKINDTFGHSVGDQVLVELAWMLKSDLRSFDHVARVGGEEFAILFPHTDLTDAATACERIVQFIESETISTNAGGIPVTISAGLSILQPKDGAGSDVLRRADELLYQAKAAGRNCVKVELIAGPAVSTIGLWPASLRSAQDASGRA
ncbi:MAG: GGDEF domain-containing protein [Pseudomonadota bacterium]